MATKVIMPKQGLQMTEGMITKWLIREGQPIKAGEPLFAMETDKLSIEIMAPASGILLKILRQEGETVPITETIAMIGEPGEDYTGELSGIIAAAGTEAGGEAMGKEKSTEPNRIFATPRARTLAASQGNELAALAGSGPDGLIVARDIHARPAVPAADVRATPLAARIAMQNAVPLTGMTGTGSHGKITRADVEASLAALSGNRLIPLTGMRRAIAERMKLSLQEMAQANHRMKVDMGEVVRLREQFKTAGLKVSFTDFLVKVVARALIEFPILNATLTPEGILLHDTVNMGIAVALENGLVVPVIPNADRLSLSEISAASAALIEKAQKGQLLPDDYAGGTFTITNLGMLDIDEFTAIINPPESAILAVGKIDRIPVVLNDEIVIRPIMMLSLTYDHRIIDGAPAARFLQRVKQLLQNPLLLL